jgi:hypothetical protein
MGAHAARPVRRRVLAQFEILIALFAAAQNFKLQSDVHDPPV